MNFLERQDMQEVLQHKAQIDLLLAALAPKQEIIEGAVEAIKSYIQLALPSTNQKSKIEDINAARANKDELKSVRERLAKTRVSRQGKQADG